jgi:negative regulator of flagellin synthesis FlgM
MKIDNLINNYDIAKNVSNTPSNEIDGKKLPDEQKLENNKSGDAIVNLSRASKEVQLAKEVIESAQDIREDKVAVIREKIESGSYQVNNQAVAEKLVNEFIDNLF